jgi:hypothetical protein
MRTIRREKKTRSLPEATQRLARALLNAAKRARLDHPGREGVRRAAPVALYMLARRQSVP